MPIKPDRIITIDSAKDVRSLVSRKFDEMSLASALAKAGTQTFFDWIEEGRSHLITLYRPITVIEFDLIRQAHFARFMCQADQKCFYLFTDINYARQVALVYSKRQPAYTVKCSLRHALISRYNPGSYPTTGGGKGYQIPIEHIDMINENLIGKVGIDQVFFVTDPLDKIAIGD
jgi:hypothetical protein